MDTTAHPRARKITPREAAQQLADRDPVIARLLTDAGPPLIPASHETNLEMLVRAVTYQQLAGAAARSIHGRLLTALGNEVTAERVLALPEEALRGAGLSAAKTATLRDLSAKVLDGTVTLEPRRIGRLSDEEIVTQLSAVRGIGRWTAEMFLIFQLRRLDVWPTGDLGVRRGFGLAWGIPTPAPKQLETLGEPYRPYRSILAWYCWQASALYGKQAVAVPVS